MDAKDIENNLKGVPPLTTLRQGIVVLSRQWKNALYTPILIEYNLRSRGLKNLYSAQVSMPNLHAILSNALIFEINVMGVNIYAAVRIQI